MALVDIVVVTFNSREVLRDCISPFVDSPDARVIVVDNASADDTPAAVQDLPVSVVQMARNSGFAAACNEGFRKGEASFVLFLNPDARISSESLLRLVQTLDEDHAIGLVGPRIVNADGSLAFSQRRFPRLRSTYSQALFLHRLFPTACWTDELIRDSDAYEHPRSVDWLSGACVLLRRAALEAVGGWDDSFFLYREDCDLCHRLRDAGFDVRFESRATAIHIGAASASPFSLLPVLAESRIRYARRHGGRSLALLERVGIILGASTHIGLAQGGIAARVGHLRSLFTALGRSPARP